MNGLAFLASVVSSLAWPVALIVVLVLGRGKIWDIVKGIAERMTKGEVGPFKWESASVMQLQDAATRLRNPSAIEIGDESLPPAKSEERQRQALEIERARRQEIISLVIAAWSLAKSAPDNTVPVVEWKEDGSAELTLATEQPPIFQSTTRLSAPVNLGAGWNRKHQ